jgi:predicted nucleotidyltransferase
MQYIDDEEQNEVSAWVETAVRRLVHELAPKKIILFGSWARKTATRRSDIDLCVIWDTNRPSLERIGRVLELLSDAPRPVEPVVYTPKEWGQMREHVPFVRRIDEEGTVLYERRAVVE